jgi:hypothetical protein
LRCFGGCLRQVETGVWWLRRDLNPGPQHYESPECGQSEPQRPIKRGSQQASDLTRTELSRKGGECSQFDFTFIVHRDRVSDGIVPFHTQMQGERFEGKS